MPWQHRDTEKNKCSPSSLRAEFHLYLDQKGTNSSFSRFFIDLWVHSPQGWNLNLSLVSMSLSAILTLCMVSRDRWVWQMSWGEHIPSPCTGYSSILGKDINNKKFPHELLWSTTICTPSAKHRRYLIELSYSFINTHKHQVKEDHPISFYIYNSQVKRITRDVAFPRSPKAEGCWSQGAMEDQRAFFSSLFSPS